MSDSIVPAPPTIKQCPFQFSCLSQTRTHLRAFCFVSFCLFFLFCSPFQDGARMEESAAIQCQLDDPCSEDTNGCLVKDICGYSGLTNFFCSLAKNVIVVLSTIKHTYLVSLFCLLFLFSPCLKEEEEKEASPPGRYFLLRYRINQRHKQTYNTSQPSVIIFRRGTM